MLSLSTVRSPSRLPALVIGILVLVTMLAVQERFHRVQQDRLAQIDRNFTLQEAAALRARIERELNATLYLMNGLAAYVSAHEGLLEADRARGVLRAIYGYSQHLRNVGLAPNNVLRYIYPSQGNEAAIGLRYKEVPGQWPAVARAMQERRTIMVGPIDLVQGGRGLVVRTPVYLEGGRYWGVLSLVIDSESLFRAADFTESSGGTQHALRWAPASDLAAPIIRGSAAVFKQSPVIQRITVPGGHWQLASVRQRDKDLLGLALLRSFGLGLALLFAIVAFLLVDLRIRSAWEALHDPLTRLPNRRMFREQAGKILRDRRPGGPMSAIAYIDLNGFKAVNDTHGHSIGDRVLAEVGRRLAAGAEKRELVARLGGDEFAMLIERVETIEAAQMRLHRLIEEIAAAGRELAPDCPLGAAIGIAFCPDDGDRVEHLLLVADQRMYADKRNESNPSAE